MKYRTKWRIYFVIVVIYVCAVLGCYFCHVGFPGSQKFDWGSFGSYVGGMLAIPALIVVAYTLAETKRYNWLDNYEKTFSLAIQRWDEFCNRGKAVSSLTEHYERWATNMEERIPFHNLDIKSDNNAATRRLEAILAVLIEADQQGFDITLNMTVFRSVIALTEHLIIKYNCKFGSKFWRCDVKNFIQSDARAGDLKKDIKSSLKSIA